MALKTYNPVTSAQRQLVLVDRTGLHAGKPVKALTEGKNSTGGRHPVTPWGKPTKGMKTRKNKRTAKFIMASRHARKQK